MAVTDDPSRVDPGAGGEPAPRVDPGSGGEPAPRKDPDAGGGRDPVSGHASSGGSRARRARAAGSDRLHRAEIHWPLIGRAVAAARRYKETDGNREAAALTYLGFLSLFPVVLLAASVLGFVVRNGAELRRSLLEASDRVVPGSAAMMADSIDAVTHRAGTIGVVGLLGLLWAGLALTAAVRRALDRAFETDRGSGLRSKLHDLGAMVVLGLLLALSIGLASLSAGLLNTILRHLGVKGVGARVIGVSAALLLTFGTQLALFLVLFAFLPDHRRGWRPMLPGAVVAALGWTGLATVGGWYVSTSAARASAAYGITAALLGLLLAINLSARMTLLAAHWAAVGWGSPPAGQRAAGGRAAGGRRRSANMLPRGPAPRRRRRSREPP